MPEVCRNIEENAKPANRGSSEKKRHEIVTANCFLSSPKIDAAGFKDESVSVKFDFSRTLFEVLAISGPKFS